MISTERILFSLQMAEESLQEVHLLFKDNKTRSLLNSLYNVFYYGMETLLLKQDIHCRSHSELKKTFFEKVIRAGLLKKDSSRWENKIEDIFRVKEENEKGKKFTDEEVNDFIKRGEAFLKSVKRYLLV
ncbi:MAG: HEPN domain-containing protein [Nitrospirae bacterium]|nr:HEPN domain-containing protein [Nitrospirota bacterium]